MPKDKKTIDELEKAQAITRASRAQHLGRDTVIGGIFGGIAGLFGGVAYDGLRQYMPVINLPFFDTDMGQGSLLGGSIGGFAAMGIFTALFIHLCKCQRHPTALGYSPVSSSTEGHVSAVGTAIQSSHKPERRGSVAQPPQFGMPKHTYAINSESADPNRSDSPVVLATTPEQPTASVPRSTSAPSLL